MNSLKKILVIGVVFCMMLTCSISAFAIDDPTYSPTDVQTIVENVLDNSRLTWSKNDASKWPELDPSDYYKENGVTWEEDSNVNYLKALNLSSVSFISQYNGALSLKDLDRLEILILKGTTAVTSLDLTGSTKVKLLDISGTRISAITGLSELDALETLNVSGARLTALNIDNNVALKDLDISSTEGIKTIDLTNNVALEVLNASGSKLTALNTDTNVALKDLDISSTGITDIDLTNNVALEVLNASKANKLTVLNTDANVALKDLNISGTTGIKTIDLTNNVALEVLNVSGSNLTALNTDTNVALKDLNISNTAEIKTINLTNNVALEVLDVSNSNLTALNIDTNVALQDLNISGTEGITAIDLTNNVALEVFNASGSKLAGALDLSGNAALENLDIRETDVTSINLTNNVALVVLNASESKLAGALDLSGNVALENLNISKTEVTGINLTNTSALEVLNASESKLTGTLDTSDSVNLENLNISKTDVTGINLTNNVALVVLNASETNLAGTLDTSTNVNLENLNISKTGIDNVDLTNNVALERFDASETDISGMLNTDTNTALWYLNINKTGVTELDLSNNTNLTELHIQDLALTKLDTSSARVSVIDMAGVTTLEELNISNASLKGTEIVVDEEKETIYQLATIGDNPNLVRLELANSNIDTLDITNNTKLVYLDVTKSKLKELDLSGNRLLETLKMSGMDMSKIDFSENYILSYLDVSGSSFEKLDLSRNNLLTYLDISKMDKMTSIDLSKNLNLLTLIAKDSKLTSLDLSKHGQLQKLDVSGSTDLDGLVVSGARDLKELNISSTIFTSIDLTYNKDLEVLIAKNNYLNGLDITNNIKLTEVDISGARTLREVNFEENVNLEILNLSGTNLRNLDLTKNVKLKSLDLSYITGEGVIKEVDLTNQYSTLEVLNLSRSHIVKIAGKWDGKTTDIDFGLFTALKDLNMDGILNINSIDVSQNVNLEKLNISNINFKKGNNPALDVDLTNNVNLKELNISTTNLETIDLSQNVNLEVLNASRIIGGMTELDLSTNTKLVTLNVSGSKLTEIALSSNTYSDLKEVNLDGNRFTLSELSKWLDKGSSDVSITYGTQSNVYEEYVTALTSDASGDRTVTINASELTFNGKDTVIAVVDKRLREVPEIIEGAYDVPDITNYTINGGSVEFLTHGRYMLRLTNEEISGKDREAVVYTGYIDIWAQTAAEIAENANNSTQGAAELFDKARLGGKNLGGNFDALLGAIVDVSDDSEAASAMIRQMTGDGIAISQWNTIQSIKETTRSISSLAAFEGKSITLGNTKINAKLQAIVGFGSEKVENYSITRVGGIFAADYTVLSGLKVGAAISIFQNGLNWEGSDTEFKSSTLLAAIYARYQPANYFVDAQLGLGRADMHGVRSIDAISKKGFSVYSLKWVHASIGGGYAFNLGGFVLTPNASINYINARTEDVTEDGLEDLNLAVGSTKINSLEGMIGLDIRRKFDLPKVNLKITPFVNVGVGYQLLDNVINLDTKISGIDGKGIAGFLESDQKLDAESPEMSKLRIDVSGGIQIDTSDNVNFQLEYNGSFQGTYMLHQIKIGAGVAW